MRNFKKLEKLKNFGWTSTKDKMPEEQTDCLISDGKEISFGYWESDSGMCTGETYCPEGFDDDFVVVWVDEANKLKTEGGGFPCVTHWVDLPPPPNV